MTRNEEILPSWIPSEAAAIGNSPSSEVDLTTSRLLAWRPLLETFHKEPERPDFETAWAVISKMVFHYCNKNLNDPVLAEDVTQNTALKAWRFYEGLQDTTKFQGWVMKIARNEVNRALDRRWRISQREFSLETLTDENALAHVVADADNREGESPLTERFLAVLPAAVAARMVSSKAARVLKCWNTIEDPTCSKVAEVLSISEINCVVLRWRGWQNLITFAFVHNPELVGGPDGLARALEKAQGAPSARLNPIEGILFQRIVLERNLRYQPKGWLNHLRSACTKVARHLKLEIG